MTTPNVTQITAAKVRAAAAVKRMPILTLADRSGIGYSALLRRTRGEVDFTIGELVAVAYALSVPPVELMPEQEVAA